MIRHKSSFEIKNEVERILSSFVENGDFAELSIFVPQTGIVKNDIEIAFSGDENSVAEAIEKVKLALKQIGE